MTALEIFQLASALMYETTSDDADSKKFSVQFLNIHLQECLPAENSIRRFKGTTELTAAPWITALETTIDFDDKITRGALPYALAYHFYLEARDPATAAAMKMEYENALSRASVCIEEDITDAYATEA